MGIIAHWTLSHCQTCSSLLQNILTHTSPALSLSLSLSSGTGTVVVRVMDENDNPPRLARRHWELEVDETPPEGPPPTTTLLELTAADRDARNAFLYRVSVGRLTV